MKKNRWFINGQTLIQETYCLRPMLAIPIHEHAQGRSHITAVVSGSIKIFNDAGWEIILIAGDEVDLHNDLKHGIHTLSDETTFHNITPLERFSQDEIDEFIGAGTLIYEDKKIIKILRIEDYSYALNAGFIDIEMNVLVDDDHGDLVLDFVSIEDRRLQLDLSCGYGDSPKDVIKVQKSFSTDGIDSIVIFWNNRSAETIIDF